MDLRLAGKSVLVTGATSATGLAITSRLVECGADVTICDGDKLMLGKIAEELGVRGILTDLTTEHGARILNRALRGIDVLISCFEIYETKLFEDVTDGEWVHLFESNVLTGIRLARVYLPHMQRQGWGRIVFISSEAALLVPPDQIQYAMTKAAQLAVASGLAAACHGTGVTVNAVMLEATSGETVKASPAAKARYMAAFGCAVDQNLASLAENEVNSNNVAELVAYFASPLSSATNGAVMRASDKPSTIIRDG